MKNTVDKKTQGFRLEGKIKIHVVENGKELVYSTIELDLNATEVRELTREMLRGAFDAMGDKV